MLSKIRNFVITAHIDHGKSTLADRMLELTGTVEKREFRNQFLDQMDLERERGITIKLQPVRMIYQCRGEGYLLNLVDTPGHVDFSYEVSRSLAAVEGAILLVDVTQGIQAQTLANLHLVQKQGLKVIPVVNKVDLAFSKDFLFELKQKIGELVGCRPEEVLEVSAKTGQGVQELLEAVVERVPPPQPTTTGALRALVFDSVFDSYKGAVAYLRVMEGELRKNDKIKFLATNTEAEALEVGVFKPKLSPVETLREGEIGYVATGVKNPGLVKVGDTVLKLPLAQYGSGAKPLPGYKEPQPVVFVNFYPEEANKFDLLELALGKLKLNDASLFYTKEKQEVLGQGFRLGLLGTLHLEVVKERLKREYQLDPVVTIPTVLYKVVAPSGQESDVYSPSDLPSADQINELREPWVRGEIIAPPQHLSGIFNLIQLSRGLAGEVSSLSEHSILINFVAPLSEIIIDFYDKLKSVSQGYASLSYEISEWQKGDLVKLDVLVNNERVDAFSRIVPRERSYPLGKLTIEKLKEILPQEAFPVPLQAAIGSTIIARVTISASKKKLGNFGKNGGDRTRKMKLWKKQKEGKKRLSQFGKVNLEPSVFFEVFKATK